MFASLVGNYVCRLMYIHCTGGVLVDLIIVYVVLIRVYIAWEQQEGTTSLNYHRPDKPDKPEKPLHTQFFTTEQVQVQF